MQENKQKLMDLFYSQEWDAVIPGHLSSVLPFLSKQTFHIFAEYAYANAFIKNDKNLDFWRNIYLNIQKYYNLNNSIETFDALIQSIQKHGFDSNYPIPVDTNYHIIDGSHRLSISMALGITPYFYMCQKKSTLFPKEKFTILSKEQIKALNGVYQTVMKKFSITIDNKNIFYIAGKELNFWNDCMKIKTISENSCFFILRLPYDEYKKIVKRINIRNKHEYHSLGIIVTTLSYYKIKKILPSSFLLPHSSNILTQNIKNYCNFI